MGSSQICMLITWNVGSPSQPYNRKRGLLKYEIISSTVWFTLRAAARGAAVYSTRESTRLAVTLSNSCKVLILDIYIRIKLPNPYFIYREMYKHCSWLKFLGYLSSSYHNLSVINKHNGVTEHIWSPLHSVVSISPSALPLAAFVTQNSRELYPPTETWWGAGPLEEPRVQRFSNKTSADSQAGKDNGASLDVSFFVVIRLMTFRSSP